MSNFDNAGHLQRSGLSSRSSLRSNKNEEAKLLNLLHQELKDIHEGMVRTNTALFELIDEMRLMRKSTNEDSTT